MNFRDVPNLQKFENYARSHSDDETIMDCYKRVREVIAPVPKPTGDLNIDGGSTIESLKASCEAVEKSTRLIWACASAADQVTPRLWDYVPDYAGSLEYFLALNDIELMAVTTNHRIIWEEE